MRYPVGALAVFVLAGTLQSIPVRAQFQNPIQAAKDAYNKAKQQSQQQKRQGQTQNQRSAPTQTASTAEPAAPDPQNDAASNDCCSADALKEQAASASSLDIVGIKLGMRPAQVTAAIKAYNPAMKFGVVNTRLERPSNTQGFVRVPRYIYAQAPNLNATNGQVERITIEFTSPPNPPVVQEVERFVQFQTGQPVLASNLMDSLRKKYGQENAGSPENPTWLYDSNGKLLTQARNTDCQPQKDLASVIVPSDLTHDAQDGGINLSNTVDNLNLGLTANNCVPYLFVRASGTGVAPNDKVFAMTVWIRSGALTYNSMKATHNWLQSEADAIKKKQDADAAGRKGPKL